MTGIVPFLARFQQQLASPMPTVDGKRGRATTAAGFTQHMQTWLGDVVDRFAPDVYRRIIAEAYSGLVLANPVGNKATWKRNLGKPASQHQPKGYVGGTSRRLWRIDRGTNAGHGAGPALDPYLVLTQVSLRDRVSISNPQRYMPRLNEGWSKQAPAGWIDAVFARVAAKYVRVA